MKKYLNNNLFYQGDANIFLSLSMVYISTFILLLILTNNYFSTGISYYLYNQTDKKFIFSAEGVLLLIAYIGIVYIITVGIFKRKKWSTFLAGPFSRLDIRKRELIIVIISVLIFVGMYLFIIIKNYIQYQDIVVYIANFYKMVLLDVIRIISLSIIIIGVVAVLDSIFANLYYLIAATVISFIYSIFLLINFDSLLSYYSYGEWRGLRYVYNGLYEYIGFMTIGNAVTDLQIISTSIVFIIIGISLIFLSKILTNRMLVENMNEGIILSFPKKIAKFVVTTLGGVLTAPYISSIIDEIYFKHSLGVYELALLKVIIIIVVSLVTYYIFRNFKKVKKDVYY
ncbi:MAG: hypothetical protein HUJ77_02550 [Clostridium sp.]|uniref:hypothetical protein n=1 Tax=Clostridium sp. TaxID=1506 RepID=UPI0025C23588|nr:hypothetical protein [Clostridium sp.]MCF0147258.1 hypothetical protein [Clostridium sp.]